MPRIGSHVAWPDSTACEMSRTWTHIPAAEYRRGTEDSDAADAEAAEDRCAAARSLSSYLLSASSCLRRSFIALGRTDGIPALGPVSPAQQITANVLQNAVSWLLLWLFSPRKSLHNCWTSATHCKGKGLDTCYIATYMSGLVTTSALQSRKWQLIGMSQWCRSALCGHPLPALMDNWTHGAASRHTIAPISHTRPSPRSRSYYSFPVPLRVGGWVGLSTVSLMLAEVESLIRDDMEEVDLHSTFTVVPHTQGAQVRITQCYLQITPYLPLPHKRSPAYYSFIYPERMKGWVGLVGWPTADGLPTSGHPSAAGWAQDRESLPVKDRRSTTVPRNQTYDDIPKR